MKRSNYFCLCELVAAVEERCRIGQQRLNLLHDRLDIFLDRGLYLFLLAPLRLEEVAGGFGDEGVDEEGDLGAEKRTARGVGRWDKVRRVLIGQKIRDYSRLGQNLAIVFYGWNETPRVDFKIFRGPRDR